MATFKVYERVGKILLVETGTFETIDDALSYINTQLSPKFESNFRISKFENGEFEVIKDLHFNKITL